MSRRNSERKDFTPVTVSRVEYLNNTPNFIQYTFLNLVTDLYYTYEVITVIVILITVYHGSCVVSYSQSRKREIVFENNGTKT